MKKKSSVSYPQEKLVRKKAYNITTITDKSKKELNKLAKKRGTHIDYSDIPELNFRKLGSSVIGKFYRPLKKQISIRFDADVLAWFKHEGGKYQALINQVCREYMESRRHQKASKK